MFDGTRQRDVIEKLTKDDPFLGSELLQLQKKRNQADYDIRHSISRKKAEDYIKECKEFIKDLNEPK
jgi:uncharacterized protein (UPF0332 family)